MVAVSSFSTYSHKESPMTRDGAPQADVALPHARDLDRSRLAADPPKAAELAQRVIGSRGLTASCDVQGAGAAHYAARP
jgi:hypothetical protein